MSDQEELVSCPHCGTFNPPEVACGSCGTVPPSARVGAVLAGRYRLDRLIGVGGFGAVYEATHLAIGGTVAVKFLLGEWTTQPSARTRFQREAKILLRLRHPGSVSVYDFGEDGGDLFMVMELVKGRELSDELAAAPFETARIVSIATQILEVLEAAHGLGIVHRDLKPDNIMILDAGDGIERVKVLDFGLAFDAEVSNAVRLTASTSVNGTPLYMSPEQCRGREIGEKTDVYAMGVILYEMLAGAPPFYADDIAALFAQHLFVEVPKMSARGYKRTPPAALEEVTRTALAKLPQDRPNARQLREALTAAGEGRDRVSAAANAASHRAAVGALSRGERALRMPSPDRDDLTQQAEPTSMRPITPDGPRVVLWGFPDARAEALRSVLAVNGVAAEAWAGEEPMAASGAGKKLACTLLCWDARTMERMRRLREGDARGPLLVADVSDAGAMPELVRMGASDVTTSDVGDDVVCKKTMRLVRRGR